MDREKLYQAYHTLLSASLTWAFVLIINQYYHLRIQDILSAFYTLLPAVLIYLFDINKKYMISYLLLGSMLPIMTIIFAFTKTNPFLWGKSILHWCRIYDGSKELYVAANAHIIIIITTIVSEILFYLITRKQLLKILLAAALMVGMIVLSVADIEINKVVLGVEIFYILTILVEVSGIIHNKRAGKQEKKESILYIAPICLILSILTVLLPSKTEPIEWRAVKTVYNRVQEQINSWKIDLNYYFGNGSEEFAVNLTGFSSKSSNLNKGNIIIKDQGIALKLEGLEKGKSVYLMGAVSDIYTGTGWKKSHLDYLKGEKEYKLDYAELFCALARQDQTVLENNSFLKRQTLHIIYNNIKTKTFFYPLKLGWFDLYSGHTKMTSDTAQMNFKKGRGRGTSYQVMYYEMNLEGNAFQAMLRAADSFSYAENTYQSITIEKADYLEKYIFNDDSIDNRLIFKSSYELLKQRAKIIKSRYCTLPDTLPDRVYQLAQEITGSYGTKYDKLKAIEAYLMSNYTYSLSVPTVPEGKDFTDYFLFEDKTGYCTYFATSMAVLGRCIGIPTRYVEGFYSKLEVCDTMNRYPVNNSQAHAWAEAYIEGIGWIPFEATAPNYNSRYTVWQEPIKTKNKEITRNNSFSNPEESLEPLITPPLHSLFTEAVIQEKTDHTKGIILGIAIFISVVSLLFMVIIAYYLILKYRYNKVFDKADYSKKSYLLFLRILKQLRRQGYHLAPQETILMLADRVKNKLEYESVTFLTTAGIFMRYRYAQEELTKEDFHLVHTFYQGLAKKEQDEQNHWKVWLEEFLFLTKNKVD